MFWSPECRQQPRPSSFRHEEEVAVKRCGESLPTGRSTSSRRVKSALFSMEFGAKKKTPQKVPNQLEAEVETLTVSLASGPVRFKHKRSEASTRRTLAPWTRSFQTAHDALCRSVRTGTNSKSKLRDVCRFSAGAALRTSPVSRTSGSYIEEGVGRQHARPPPPRRTRPRRARGGNIVVLCSSGR